MKILALMLLLPLFSFAARAEAPRCNVFLALNSSCSNAKDAAQCAHSSIKSAAGTGFNCVWAGSTCRRGPSCAVPAEPDFTVAFERYHDGRAACVARIRATEFSPFTKDGLLTDVRVRAAPTGSYPDTLPDPSEWESIQNFQIWTRTFTEKPNRSALTQSFEFILPLSKEDLRRLRSYSDLACEAWMGDMYAVGGGNYADVAMDLWTGNPTSPIQCRCPDQYLSLLKRYQKASWFGLIDSPNDIVSVCETCGNQSLVQRVGPFRENSFFLALPVGPRGGTGADGKPYPPGAGPRVSQEWVAACMETEENVETRDFPVRGGGTLTQIIKREKTFKNPWEIHLGLFELEYTLQQIQATIDHIRQMVSFNRSVINSINANDFSQNLTHSVTAESLASAVQLFQIRAAMEAYRELTAGNYSNLEAELVNFYFRNRPFRAVDRWKEEVFKSICPPPQKCGYASNLDAAFRLMVKGLGDHQSVLQGTRNKILRDFPWLQTFDTSVFTQGLFAALQTRPSETDSQYMTRLIATVSAEIKGPMLAHFQRAQAAVVTLDANLKQLRQYLTCPDRVASDKEYIFDELMASLLEVANVPIPGAGEVKGCLLPTDDDGTGNIDSIKCRKRILVQNYAREQIRGRRDARRLVQHVNGLIESTAISMIASFAGPGMTTVIGRGLIAGLGRAGAWAASNARLAGPLAKFKAGADVLKLSEIGQASMPLLQAVVIGSDLYTLGSGAYQLVNAYTGRCQILAEREDLVEYISCVKAAVWGVNSAIYAGLSMKVAAKAGIRFFQPRTRQAQKHVQKIEEGELFAKKLQPTLHEELRDEIAKTKYPWITGGRIPPGTLSSRRSESGWGYYRYVMSDGTEAYAYRAKEPAWRFVPSNGADAELQALRGLLMSDTLKSLKILREIEEHSAGKGFMAKVFGVDFNNGDPLIIFEKINGKKLGSDNWCDLTALQQQQLEGVLAEPFLRYVKSGTLAWGRVFEPDYIFVMGDGTLKLGMPVRWGSYVFGLSGDIPGNSPAEAFFKMR